MRWGLFCGCVAIIGCEPSVPPSFTSIDDTNLVSLELRPATVNVGVDGSAALALFGRWSDGTEAEVTSSATFWSSDEAIVSARNDPGHRGTVVGRRLGNAELHAQLGTSSAVGTVSVELARARRLVVTPASTQVPLGQLAAFSVVVEREDGTSGTAEGPVSWRLVDPSIARQELAGFVGVRGGTTRVEVSAQGLTGGATLEVLPATVTHLRVDLSRPIIERGERAQLTAYAVSTDGSTRDVTSETNWSTSSPTVALVSAAGEATGRLPGATVLSGSWRGAVGTNLLTVLGDRPAFFELLPLTPVVTLGTTRQLFAVAWFPDGSTEDFSPQVVWSTLDPAIASFSNAAPGLLTTHAPGQVRLEVELAGVRASTTVTVVAGQLVGLELDAPSSVAVGTTTPLSLSARYSSGALVEVTAHATWSSSAPAIGEVTNSAASRGLFIASAPGTTAVQVSWSGRSVGAQIVVAPPAGAR